MVLWKQQGEIDFDPDEPPIFRKWLHVLDLSLDLMQASRSWLLFLNQKDIHHLELGACGLQNARVALSEWNITWSMDFPHSQFPVHLSV